MKFKSWWKKASFKASVTIAVLGGAIGLFVVKQSGRKPDSGVIVNGDTLVQTHGDSIRTDTVKLNN